MSTRSDIRKSIIEQIHQRVEIETGYRFIFTNPSEVNHLLDRFIRQEEQCCSFLNFSLSSSSSDIELVIQTRRLDRVDTDKDFITNGLLSQDFLD